MGGLFTVATAAYEDRDSSQRAFLALNFTPLLGWSVGQLWTCLLGAGLSAQARAW